jgi:hypothetical protein
MFTRFAIVFLAFLVVQASGTGSDEKGKSPKVVNKAARMVFPTKGHAVIRSARELQKYALPGTSEETATALAAKILGVPTIDWEKQMLVVIDAGVRRSGGFSVLVGDLVLKNKALTVHWILKSPTGAFTRTITHPGATLLLERFDGDVHVEPPTPKSALGK